MSVWFKPKTDKRSTYVIPAGPRYYADMNDYSQPFDPTDPTNSLQVVACWGAIDLIASLVSELPVDVYRGTGPTREQLDLPTTLMDPGADGQGIEDWSWQALLSWLLCGNVAGEIINRDPRSGFATQVALAHPANIQARRDGDGTVHWYLGGPEVPKSSVFHRRAYPISGQVLGMSPIAWHATTLGWSINGTKFGSAYFTDNAAPSGILTNEDEEMNETRSKEAKRRFMQAIRGTREPVVFGKGWKWQQISIAPEEAQFLETNQFTAAQCARIYGPGIAEVLGYESGGSLTYATVEGRSLHLLVYSLSKWITRHERMLSLLIPRGQYVKLNRKALLSTTNIERFRAYTMALQGKWMVPNEVRELEDEKPVPWGDEPLGGDPAADPMADDGGSVDNGGTSGAPQPVGNAK